MARSQEQIDNDVLFLRQSIEQMSKLIESQSQKYNEVFAIYHNQINCPPILEYSKTTEEASIYPTNKDPISISKLLDNLMPRLRQLEDERKKRKEANKSAMDQMREENEFLNQEIIRLRGYPSTPKRPKRTIKSQTLPL